jgi:uncharacterized protein (DUF2384 family)
LSDAPDASPAADVAGEDTAPTPPVRKSRTFRPARVQMPPAAAARQAKVMAVAWTALGNRERVMEFLNADHPALDARPLDLAIASDEGLARVVQALADIRSTDASAPQA